MTAVLYDASVPVFLRYLERLAGFVDAAEAFARAHQRSVDEHVTAAYAVLRSQGVPLGKQDFDGFHAYPR